MKTITKALGLLIISTLTINHSFAQWTEDADGIHSTNSSKLVGIGTTTPTAPLDINNNILLGLDYPAYGVRIKANWPGYNGGWTRGFYIANQDNSKNYFGLGVNGGATAGITTMSYAWLGPDYDNAYMSFLPNGNVGIGTNTPTEKLDVRGNVFINSNIDDNHIYWEGHNMTLGTPAGSYNHNVLKLKPGGSSIGTLYSGLEMYVANSTTSFDKVVQISTYSNSFFNGGNVGIGTTNPTEKLTVNGNIKAKKIIATQTGWADYVFDKDYKLMNLNDLSAYVQQHKHLPEIPTTKQIEKEGVDVGTNQALLLKKIEELTLYIIEQQKQIAEQNERIKKLENEKMRQ